MNIPQSQIIDNVQTHLSRNITLFFNEILLFFVSITSGISDEVTIISAQTHQKFHSVYYSVRKAMDQCFSLWMMSKFIAG